MDIVVAHSLTKLKISCANDVQYRVQTQYCKVLCRIQIICSTDLNTAKYRLKHKRWRAKMPKNVVLNINLASTS